MIKRALLVPLLSILSICANAQAGEDYKLFIDSAGGLSNLYRGTAPLAYRFIHTGTFYAYSENFEKGEVVFNDKLYTDVQLNINSHIDELYLKVEESGRFILLNKEFVQYFKIGERRFINISEKFPDEGGLNLKNIPNGYYEVMYENNRSKLLKRTKKIYAERINHFASSVTNSKVERMFLPAYTFYLADEKRVQTIKRYRDIISFYGVRRKAVTPFIRENNLDIRENQDLFFKEIVRFIESSGINQRK